MRVLTSLSQKPRRCYFVEKGSVNDGRTDSAAAAVQSPATDDDDDNNKVDSTTKDDDTAASPTDDSRKKADEEEEEEEDETDFLPSCICGEESASLWPLVDNKADDGPSDTTKE